MVAAVLIMVLLIDQLIKIYIKTHFYIGEDYTIFPWFHLRFIQNNGMAFGMELGSKLFLSLFRLLAICLLGWYLVRLCRKRLMSLGYVATIALITAGAAGNLIDCAFYGDIFNNPYPPEVATFVPFGTGYSSFFHGYVVDMFYFPLFTFSLGGHEYTFFEPVFNFADAAITVGMAILIIGYYKELGATEKELEHRKER
ncbi:MAG: lipoprotein signal peptidase [Muribaculaceae bacterium]|nr:lipoprotein signal peptidase [Muribaculaceae bacterium]